MIKKNKGDNSKVSDKSKDSTGFFAKFVKNLPKVDFSGVEKYWVLLPIFFILFAMFIGFQVRSGPVNLDGLEDRVRANVMAQVQNIIINDIEAQYPNLNEIYKQEMIIRKLSELEESGMVSIQGEIYSIDEIVTANLNVVKSAFKTEDGQTYFIAIDPYFYYKQTENYYFNGHTGDSFIEDENGTLIPFASYRLAPEGRVASFNPDFHTWFGSMLFRMNGISESSSEGEKIATLFLVSVFMAVLAIIPIYFIVRYFTNDLFAFFASLLLMVQIIFVSRTMAGFYDTEAYGVTMVLLVLFGLMFAYFFRDEFKLRDALLGGVLAGFFMGLLIWSWSDGGWFAFVFLLAAMILYISYLKLSFLISYVRNKSFDWKIWGETWNNFYMFLAFLVSSFVFTYLLDKSNIFALTYSSMSSYLGRLGTGSDVGIWPNVLSSVAELNPASFESMISSVGGSFLFFLALLGLLLFFLDFKKEGEISKISNLVVLFSIAWFGFIVFAGFLVPLSVNERFLFLFLLFFPMGLAIFLNLYAGVISKKLLIGIFIAIWFSGAMYMSFNGVRFIMLLGPSVAICLGFALYYIHRIVSGFFEKEFSGVSVRGASLTSYVLVFALFLFLFLPMYSLALSQSSSSVPNFDDAWFETMYEIKEVSSSDSIITSWWDFGHFFAAVADRGVTFDGASQTQPQSHWVGKLLLSDDEVVSKDILRMLSCSANGAFNLMLDLRSENGSDKDAVLVNRILYETFGVSDEEKVEILRREGFTELEIDEIRERLFCENPKETFLITSGDMTGKAPVWAHWGLWDFTRKYVHDNYLRMSVSEMAKAIEEDEDLIRSYVSELEEINLRSRLETVNRRDLINQWFAPYPSFIPIENSYTTPCFETNEAYVCLGGNLLFNKSGGEVSSPSGYDRDIATLIFPSQNGIERIQVNEEGSLEAIVASDGSSARLMLVQKPLGSSLYTRLFFLDGIGSNYFEQFSDKQSMTGVRIRVWRVHFDGVPEREFEEFTFDFDLSDFDESWIMDGEGFDFLIEDEE